MISSRQRQNTLDWKNFAGGKCMKCGYDRCLAALDYHHRDPATKLFHISQRVCTVRADGNGKVAQAIRAEIAKCDLVCANCHREIHSLDINE